MTHFVDRNGGIDGAVQTQFPHSIGQGSQVDGVRVGEEHSINLMNVTAWGKKQNTYTCVKQQSKRGAGECSCNHNMDRRITVSWLQ